MGVSYPKPNEKMKVRDLANAVGAARAIAEDCQRNSAKAVEAFEDERKRTEAKAAKFLAGMAKAALRAGGKPPAGSELDGPEWARFDSMTGYHMGISVEASAQSIARAEAKAKAAAMEANLASLEKSGVELSAAAAAARAQSELSMRAMEATRAAFMPHRENHNEFFARTGCTTAAQVDEKIQPATWLGRLVGSKKDALRARWEAARDSGVDYVGLKRAKDEAEAAWATDVERLNAASKAVDARAKKVSDWSDARERARKPAPWLDSGAPIRVTEIYDRVAADPTRLEPMLVAVSGLIPSVRAEARAGLRVGLAAAALSLSSGSLAKEQAELAKLVTNLASIEKKMKSASSSNKGSVKFDMAEMAQKLSQRSGVLKALAKSGPSQAMARIEAMDWGSAEPAQLSIEEAKTMQKAAESRFGKDSAPAKAFASAASAPKGDHLRTYDASSNDSGLSAVFWYSMLSDSGSSQIGSASMSYDVGSPAGVSDAGSSSSSFDFGSVGMSLDSSSFDTGSSSSSSSWSSSCSSSSSSSHSSCSSSSSSCSSSSSSCSSSSSSCSSGSSCSS